MVKGPNKKKLLLLVVAAIIVAVPLLLCACSQAESYTLPEEGWSPDVDCAACHVEQADSQSNQDCQISASHSDLSCMTCHTNEVELEKAHNQATQAEAKQIDGAMRDTVSDETCLECHADYAEQKVANLVDEKGVPYSPHSIPSTNAHNQDLSCASCHTMHESTDILTSSEDYCVSCHHNKIYSCGNCHAVQ